MLIVRENTECLYVKQEKIIGEGIVVAERVITKKASLRIGEMVSFLKLFNSLIHYLS